MLDAIRASGGRAVAGREASIAPWMIRAGSAEGIGICPETAVCFDVLERLIAEQWVKADEQVVVFNTGAAQKYIEALPPNLARIDKDADLRANRLLDGPAQFSRRTDLQSVQLALTGPIANPSYG